MQHQEASVAGNGLLSNEAWVFPLEAPSPLLTALLVKREKPLCIAGPLEAEPRRLPFC